MHTPHSHPGTPQNVPVRWLVLLWMVPLWLIHDLHRWGKWYWNPSLLALVHISLSAPALNSLWDTTLSAHPIQAPLWHTFFPSPFISSLKQARNSYMTTHLSLCKFPALQVSDMTISLGCTYLDPRHKHFDSPDKGQLSLGIYAYIYLLIVLQHG